MKRRMLFVFAILFIIAVGVAYATVFEGRVTAINVDKTSLTVKSRDLKEYLFECEKGVIPNAIGTGDKVIVHFKEEGNTKKATFVKPDGGC